MWLRTKFFKFNRYLFSSLNSAKRNVHSILQINNNIETCMEKQIKVQGWIYAVRKMKSITFVDIVDGSTPKILQIVIQKNIKPDKLSYGSSITAEGKLSFDHNKKIELLANNVNIIGTCDVMDGYPFTVGQHYSPDYIRQYLHWRPKTKKFSSLLRLRDLTCSTIENYLRSKEYINIHTPVLTSNDCEGTNELFIVKPCSKDTLKEMKRENIPEDEWYFNRKTFLTVSGQLHLEAAVRAFTKVYTFGTSFRAENSKSRLHLSEFRMLEVELAFINNIEHIINEVELLIKYVVENVFEKGADDIYTMGGDEIEWLYEKFTCITYDDAVNILQNNATHLETPVSYGTSLSKEQELFLVKYNNNIPIFVINWPKTIKPFYMKECEDDTSKVAAMDLLLPTVGELVGGSLREDNYEKLKSKLPCNSDLSWYLELRKHGNVPTGGFGMGFERLLQNLFNIPNIKDTLPFPRWPHNCKL